MPNTDLESIAQRLDRIEQLIIRHPGLGPGPIVDPGPEDTVRGGTHGSAAHLPSLPHRGDPPPSDLARLSRQEVQEQLHQINAEVVRLQSLGKMLNERLGQLKEG
jgi:hypothetical protein